MLEMIMPAGKLNIVIQTMFKDSAVQVVNIVFWAITENIKLCVFNVIFLFFHGFDSQRRILFMGKME